ncbi:hypothetical protein ABB07_38595 [Streptomyces incarnatus]|uniref:Integral membrane protein n=1 Tax=Streptomyces incarnatus TaxID=665007 RepID=A0ABM5TXB4_9ACTN|nr:hypothetical protein [Streptomyces incarnatus]AKJ15746.1 hypothetical protein ABB07_38595 [Streptomyces incarnatus]
MYSRWMSMPPAQGSRLDALLNAASRWVIQASQRIEQQRGMPARWSQYLLASAASAILTGATLHGLLLLTGLHGALGWVGLGSVIAVATLLLVLLARSYHLMKSEQEDRRPFVLSLFVLSAAFAAAVEALAGLTVLGSQYGIFSAAPLPLWSCEQTYLWLSADSVPLLKIPQLLRWAEPGPLRSVSSGILVLAFKFFFTLLLLRTVVVIFQLAEQHRRSERNLEFSVQKQLRINGARLPLQSVWPRASAMAAAASVFLVYFTVGADSPVRTWLTGRVPSLHVPGLTIHAGPAVSAVPEILAIVVIARLVCMVPREGCEVDRFTFVEEAKGALLDCIVMAVVILTAAAAALVVLYDFHLAGLGAPGVDGGTTSGAALQVVAWHLADSLPGPNIPGTVHWTLQKDFTGPWAGLVILGELLSVFLLLTFPVSRVIARWVDLRSVWVLPDPPLVEVPGKVKRDLNRAVAFFERVKGGEGLAIVRRYGQLPPYRDTVPIAQLPDTKEISVEMVRVQLCLYELQRSRRAMWDLFGDGPVYAAAEQAIKLVAQCYAVLTTPRPTTPRFRPAGTGRLLQSLHRQQPEPADAVRMAADAVAVYGHRLAAHYRPPSPPEAGSRP